jgi:acyl carrier protein
MRDIQSINEAKLRKLVQRVLVDEENVLVDSCKFETELDELGFDSLALAEFIVLLEDELGVMLELREFARLVTLGDVCHALQPVDLEADRRL